MSTRYTTITLTTSGGSNDYRFTPEDADRLVQDWLAGKADRATYQVRDGIHIRDLHIRLSAIETLLVYAPTTVSPAKED